MTWLIVTYVIGIFPAVAAIAAFDEWTSDYGQLPPAVHMATAPLWPAVLLAALVLGPIYGSLLWLSRLGRRIVKKYKLKRMKETDGI